MPRITRRQKKRQALTPNQVKLLTTGVSMTDPRWGTWVKPRDRQAARAAWEENRSELLADWIRCHPCTRPVAFYQWDAVEPRQRIAGEQQPANESTDFRLSVGFGGLNARLGAEDTRGNEGDWETEKQYLARIGALTPAELALL
jgi:hypothetical protein